MKKAFTLVELLVVVVVIVTLMGITFKLAGVGSESSKRNTTVNRMQRLENCLSGYYAAYGSYPPVKLHGSRDFTLKVDGCQHGIQTSQRETGELVWENVKAACQSQPIGMSYPFNKTGAKDMVAIMSTMLQENNPGDPHSQFEALETFSQVSAKAGATDWLEQQVFKFGVLSFLLPRYLIIMGGDKSANNDEFFTNMEAWKQNNQLPPGFEDGVPYASWKDVNDDVKDEPWKIAALPSQAACARWLPNLEKCLSVIEIDTLYGVDVRDPDDPGTSPLRVYSATDTESYSQQFMADGVTIKDGWENEFYYYSPPPHQGYRLWSSGPNGRTFPPWVSDEELENDSLLKKNKSMIRSWISDDIAQMKN